MDKETLRLRRAVERALRAPHEGVARRIVDLINAEQDSWREYVEAKCGAYVLLEGQRAELMQYSCRIDELKAREEYIEGILFAAEN